MSTAPRKPLISVEELHAKLTRPRKSPTLLDVRWQLGRVNGQSEYEREHLPGAVYVDLDAQLSSPVKPGGKGGRHPMPDAKSFGASMERAGVHSERLVVCYDADNSVPASRAWWLLRYYGHRDVRVLDGGLAAWVAAGLPTESGSFTPKSGHFHPHPKGRHRIKAKDVPAYAEHGALLDARPAERFRGENETVDPVAGHIPGATSVPAVDNLDDQGHFLPVSVLREKLQPKLPRADSETGPAEPAIYCGSGVQAAHLALALELAGLAKDPALYVGSWSDWISDPARPVQTGS